MVSPAAAAARAGLLLSRSCKKAARTSSFATEPVLEWWRRCECFLRACAGQAAQQRPRRAAAHVRMPKCGLTSCNTAPAGRSDR